MSYDIAQNCVQRKFAIQGGHLLDRSQEHVGVGTLAYLVQERNSEDFRRIGAGIGDDPQNQVAVLSVIETMHVRWRDSSLAGNPTDINSRHPEDPPCISFRLKKSP